jgi:hypothetical protein
LKKTLLFSYGWNKAEMAAIAGLTAGSTCHHPIAVAGSTFRQKNLSD